MIQATATMMFTIYLNLIQILSKILETVIQNWEK